MLRCALSCVVPLLGLTAPLSAQFGNFTPLGSLPANDGAVVKGSENGSIAGAFVAPVGDINGDGIVDFAIASPNTNVAPFLKAGRIEIYFGKLGIEKSSPLSTAPLDGSLGFELHGEQDFHLVGASVGVAGDINGDGLADFYFSAPGGDPPGALNAGTTYVVFGSPAIGAGGTIPLSSISSPTGFQILGSVAGSATGASAAGIGDVNGDSYPDLLIGAPSLSSLPTFISTPFPVSEMAGADLDGDGRGEIATVYEGAGIYVIYYNVGNGAFIPGLKNPTGIHPQQVALTDVDGDGDKDMILAGIFYDQQANTSFVRVQVYKNLLLGFFGAPTNYDADSSPGSNGAFVTMRLGDVNADGRDDVVLMSEPFGSSTTVYSMVVYHTNPNGTMSLIQSLAVGTQPASLALVDIDGDGDLDALASTNSPSELHSYFNDGTGSFTAGPVTALALANFAAGDLNGDSKGDIVISPKVYQGAGDGTFTQLGNLSSGGGDNALADMDNDGDLDAVAGGSTATLSVFFNKGSFHFTPAVTCNFGTQYSHFRIAKMDNDAAPDVILDSDNAAGFVAAAINRGDGTFPAASQGQGYVVFGGPAVGASGPVSLGSLNGGNGYRVDFGQGNAKLGIACAGAGDVNQDGIPDYLLGAELATAGAANSGAVLVGFGSAAPVPGGVLHFGDFSGARGFHISGGEGDFVGYSLAGGADINGDGIPDIVIGAPDTNPGSSGFDGLVCALFGGAAVGSSGSVSLASPDGTTGFRILGADNGAAGKSVATGDVNGDGVAELLLGEPFSEALGLNLGGAYLLYGRPGIGAGGTLALANLTSADGALFYGVGPGDQCGASVAVVGDIDGDGLSDFLVGAPFADTPFANSGNAYLVFGKAKGVAPFGVGTPGCSGPEPVGANSAPRIGNSGFALVAKNGPPSIGLGIIADAPSVAGTDPFALGVLLHVDLLASTTVLSLDFTPAGSGVSFASIAIPNNPLIVGLTVAGQGLFAWAGLCSPSTFGLSTTLGAYVTVQP